MPRVTTVKEVLSLEAGTQVAVFKGRIKTVWKQRSGTAQGGRDYTVQNLLCRDGELTIELVLFNQPRIDAEKEGSEIYLESEDNKSLTVVDNEWKGKKKRQLKASDNVRVSWAAPAGATAPSSQPARQQAVAQGTPKQYAAKCANGLLLAYKAAEFVSATITTQTRTLVIDTTTMQVFTMAIFGAMEKAGFIAAMPVKPEQAPKPLPKAEVAPEPEPAPYEPGDESDPEPSPEAKPTGPDGEDDVPF